MSGRIVLQDITTGSMELAAVGWGKIQIGDVSRVDDCSRIQHVRVRRK